MPPRQAPPPTAPPAPAEAFAATLERSTLTETPVEECPLTDGPEVELHAASSKPPVPDPQRYKVLREFAHGGLGRILEAEDHSLGRKVAIKELRIPSPRHHARFLREAKVTARLQHPSIVPLYDLGTWPSGEPYYSMKLVSGMPLDAVIAGAKNLDARLALVPHVIAVADAIAYAHSQRIIHRDLKPQNVLVGSFGETIVIDWGTAKDLDDPGDPGEDAGPFRTLETAPALTAAGEVIGTPVYMAPEQAAGKLVDERADVYAIGAILYEVLTGAWPHSGRNTHEVVARLIAGEAIKSVDEAQPGAPAELIAIVKKAMAHDRAVRYPSAAELATELRRFQTGQLVAAHAYTRGKLFRRWMTRHRAPVAVAAVATVILSGSIGMGVRGVIRERDATRAERDRTTAERDKLILAQADGELERDPTAAIAWLKTYPKDGAEPNLARQIALDAQSRGVARYVLPRAPDAFGQFSPDGARFAHLGPRGVEIVDLESGAITEATTEPAINVAWLPDSQRLVVQHKLAPRTAEIVDLRGGRRALDGGLAGTWPFESPAVVGDGDDIVVPTLEHGLRRYTAAGGAGAPAWVPFPISQQYTRSGARFAAMDPTGVVVWWDAGRSVAHSLALPPGVKLTASPNTYRLLGDGATLVAGATDGRLCVWTLADGQVRLFDGDHAPFDMVTASHDGRTLVTLAGASLRTWDLAAWTSQPLPALGSVNDLSLTAAGDRVLVGLADHGVIVLEIATGAHHRIGAHAGSVTLALISADGRWAATAADDHTIRLWSLTPPDRTDRRAEPETISTMAISTDGQVVAAGQANSPRMTAWIAGVRHHFDGHAGPIIAVAITPDTRTLFSGSLDQSIRRWDLATGAAVGPPLEPRAGNVIELAASRDGRRLFSAHADGTLRSWDLTAETSQTLATIDGLWSFSQSADGNVLAAGDGHGVVHMVSFDGAKTRTLVGSVAAIVHTQFAPDGRHVATGSATGEVTLWESASGATRSLGHLAGEVRQLDFSSDGRWLVAGSTGGEAALWRLDSAGEWRLRGHVGKVVAVAMIDADDSGVVTAGEDGTVRSFSLDGRPTGLRRVDGGVVTLALAGDGHHLVVGTSTGEVYRWTLADLRTEPHLEGELDSWLDRLTSARIDLAARHLTAMQE